MIPAPVRILFIKQCTIQSLSSFQLVIIMSVLSDTGIVEFIETQRLKIAPFQSSNLTPNGYDLTIAEVYIPDTDKRATTGSVEIPGKTWFMISTREVVTMSRIVSGHCWIRTSYARKGILSSFGKIDSGFSGTLTLNAFNGSARPVKLDIGATFAQLVIDVLERPSGELYAQRSGHYQHQRGVTLSRLD